MLKQICTFNNVWWLLRDRILKKFKILYTGPRRTTCNFYFSEIFFKNHLTPLSLYMRSTNLYGFTIIFGLHCTLQVANTDTGLINYIDTKAKCRHLKKLTCKGTLRQGLSEFINWRYSQSCWYFWPDFVNCCPSNLLVLGEGASDRWTLNRSIFIDDDILLWCPYG